MDIINAFLDGINGIIDHVQKYWLIYAIGAAILIIYLYWQWFMAIW